jgi:hypothetical protein
MEIAKGCGNSRQVMKVRQQVGFTCGGQANDPKRFCEKFDLQVIILQNMSVHDSSSDH